MQEIVDDLLARQLVRVSLSPYVLPALLVPKKDRTWRICVDSYAINKITVKYCFPNPHLEGMLSQIGASWSNFRDSDRENFSDGFRGLIEPHKKKYIPYHPKRRIPSFDDYFEFEEFLEWINVVDDYFESMEVEPMKQAMLVTKKFKGYVVYWWEGLQNKRIFQGKYKIRTWAKIKSKLKDNFLLSWFKNG